MGSQGWNLTAVTDRKPAQKITPKTAKNIECKFNVQTRPSQNFIFRVDGRCAGALKCFQLLPEPKADQGNRESPCRRGVPFGSQASQPPSFTKIPKQTPEANASPVSGFGWFQAGGSPENRSTGLKTRPLHLTGQS